MQIHRPFVLGLSLTLFPLAQCSKNERAASAAASAPETTPASVAAPASTPAAAPSNGVTLVKDGLSPTFTKVVSRLELGGCEFEYRETTGIISLAALVDGLLQNITPNEAKGVPPAFSVTKTVQALGLDAIAAVGHSARQRADGTFHSRSVVYSPSGRKGLLSLTGGNAEKLQLLEVAPKDTDMGIELSLKLKDFMRDSLPKILEMVPSEERAQTEAQLNQPLPIGITLRQLLEKLDVHLGLFVRIDPSQTIRFTPSSPPFPKTEGVLVIDRLGWLIEALKPQLMPMLQNPQAPITVTEANGILSIRAKGPLAAAPLDYEPVLRYDAKADRILIATRPAVFDGAANGTDIFTQRADFAEIWRDLPKEGNSCLFASKRYLQYVVDSLQHMPASSTSDVKVQEFIGKVLGSTGPLLKHSQIILLTNQEDGIASSANAFVPFNATGMGAVTYLAMISSLAMPTFAKIQERANETKEMNNARQVVIALRLYASDHEGKYPANLDDLAASNAVPDPKILKFNDPVTHTPVAWLYNSKLTDSSPATEPLLLSPSAYGGGKRVAAFNDGSVRLITETEYQQIKARY